MSFASHLAEEAARVDAALDSFLPRTGPMAAPMRHAAMAGGKRLRGFLCQASAGLYDVDRDRALRAAAAIEMVHAYSLVHDDLPCMDDDALRRGQPTVHVKWDEATAVLAGDGLQTCAFQVLGDPATGPDAVRARLVLTLANAAQAMVTGQAQDIAAETAGRALTLDEITELQANKTGALIGWAVQSGARLAGEESGALAAYAAAIGLAFQIQDDIIDLTGDAAAVGKRLQKDAEAGKATFVSLLGLEGARARATLLVDEACDTLSVYSHVAAEPLRGVARFIIERDR
ncbi:MAG: farnesyl diphosphate synthase [Pseudomonadota bacterium]